MKAKIGLITAFLLMVALAPGLTFADDFQSYNAVTDASFTSNYTQAVSVTGGSIVGALLVQAINDSLAVNMTDIGLFINSSKLTVNYPFTFSVTLRKFFVITGTDDIGLLFYLNNTDTNNNISELRGYKINMRGTVIELLRFNPTSSVSLNTSTITTLNASIDNILTLSVDSAKRIHFYIGSLEVMNYYDTAETYLSGGIAIYEITESPSTNSIYLDNLNSNASAGVSGWSVSSYPQNLDDWIGVSRDGISTDYSGCAGGTGLKNTIYGINYQPCKYFYESAYPINEVLTPSLVLKYGGALWSNLSNSLNPLYGLGIYAHIVNANACYWINSAGVHVAMFNNPAFYNGGRATSTLLYADSPPYVRNTNPFLYRGIPFICTSAENVTFEIEFNQGGSNTDIHVTIPIGYTFNPSTKEVNYSEIIDASLGNTSGNEVINTPLIPGMNEFTDFGALSGLVTPLTVLLSAVLIAGAIITRDTHSSQIGLIVIMAGCLMLSFYNILPWYITVLITIGAGFFILSQVRTGVFGNAQPA